MTTAWWGRQRTRRVRRSRRPSRCFSRGCPAWTIERHRHSLSIRTSKLTPILTLTTFHFSIKRCLTGNLLSKNKFELLYVYSKIFKRCRAVHLYCIFSMKEWLIAHTSRSLIITYNLNWCINFRFRSKRRGARAWHRRERQAQHLEQLAFSPDQREKVLQEARMLALAHPKLADMSPAHMAHTNWKFVEQLLKVRCSISNNLFA